MPSFEDLHNIDSLVLAFLLVPGLVQAALYGIYATLFCQCIYLYRQRPLEGRKALLTGTILLFILCTVQFILNSAPSAVFIAAGYNTIFSPITKYESNYITPPSYFTHTWHEPYSLIADSVFVYRCYIIWGRRRIIIWGPLLLIVASTGTGLVTVLFCPGPLGIARVESFDPRIALFITLATNVILTLLSAGRIWWISREIRRTMGSRVSRKYNTAIALITESGLMYCIAITAYLISLPRSPAFKSDFSTSDVVSTFFGVLTQMAGIIPTLIVVRMGMGISTEGAQTVILVSGIQFEHEGAGSGQAGTDGHLRAPVVV